VLTSLQKRGPTDASFSLDLSTSIAGSMSALAQLEAAKGIISARLAVWNRYHENFAELEAREALRRPVVPAECGHNGHIYYLIMPSNEIRTR
jgi:dTDP-4-amino-4,6-dideoxygalactose transaminase